MSDWSGEYYAWAPRKTAAERRADAARQLKDASRRGRAMSPVTVAGRKIAHTFWGQAWCDNLERYRDFAYRLERGRSYLRSGSVIDLKIEAGKVAAMVSGSSLYDVAIEIDAVKRDAWRAIQRDCAGGIGSRIDLLGGKLSGPVMTRLCADRTGLFPDPSAIRFTCSCPDHATMCKHVAAAMYGVGARLDHAPELLFTLRRASLDELVASAVTELPATPSGARVLAAGGLAALFGIELADAAQPASKAARERTGPARAARIATPAASPKPARRAVTSVAKAPTRAERRKTSTPATASRSPDRQALALDRKAASLDRRTAAATARKAASMDRKAAARAKQIASTSRKPALLATPATRKTRSASRAQQLGLPAAGATSSPRRRSK